MNDELPTTPGATFAQPSEVPEPLVELELDRRAATLEGIATRTCVQCGVAKATVRGTMRVRGRFSAVSLQVAVCEGCRERTRVAYSKVARADRFVRAAYFAQLAGLALSSLQGGALFFTSLSVLLLGTMGGSYLLRKRLLRDEPRLLRVGPTTVTLRAPRSWARVLLDEKPGALAGAPPKPAALGPEEPR